MTKSSPSRMGWISVFLYAKICLKHKLEFGEECDCVKCPYCGEEMQSGFIPTDSTPAQWIPDGKSQSLLKMKYAKDCIKIISDNTFFSIHAKADYCKSCGVILLKEDR